VPLKNSMEVKKRYIHIWLSLYLLLQYYTYGSLSTLVTTYEAEVKM
jgi:hypothetical protein